MKNVIELECFDIVITVTYNTVKDTVSIHAVYPLPPEKLYDYPHTLEFISIDWISETGEIYENLIEHIFLDKEAKDNLFYKGDFKCTIKATPLSKIKIRLCLNRLENQPSSWELQIQEGKTMWLKE